MAKHLNTYEVQLDFRADTSQAKKEIQSLQQNLSDAIMKAGTKTVGQSLSKDLSGAIATASKLKIQLQEAFNVDTGRLDLGKFKQSMDQSGMSLEKYKHQLSMLGPEGDQAFRQLASSIVQAEVPLRRSNALLTEFATTLKNTARWQISSSLLHGFMGAIQSAYGYAQDLNESLNNIRIVTGYNTDKMAEFAANANKAAQALSTTTTAYTNAALIYYQQGLGDEEVLGRTDVTVKMANVSRQSAEEVSDQLTAIWNNFYDGSKSLEYYADVITALGAATASSSEEISTGLEKFAAVADTVGLSYEYATSALATITATTRQSAETVGTGLRTLFARLEGLKLGETLEDGVDLNKYSKALDTIGVQILDVNGEIKDMDTILNETAAGWDRLTKAQQVAFAQTVGGVRQYTNLIALMDNWDFMQSNLEVAGGAEGTLQKQADIFAESWEGAKKRVKAAAQDIYGALLDDKFFIGLNNSLADILKNIKNFIDDIGGLKGVITALGAVFLTVFRDSISKSINDTIYGFKMMTKAGQEAYQLEKQKANQMLSSSYQGAGIVNTEMRVAVGHQFTAQEDYLKYANKMTEADKAISAELLNQQQILIKNVQLKAEEVAQTEKETKIGTRQLVSTLEPTQSMALSEKSGVKRVVELAQMSGELDGFLNRLSKIDISAMNTTDAVEVFTEQLQDLSNGGEKFNQIFGEQGAEAFRTFEEALQSKDINKVSDALIELYSIQDSGEDAAARAAARLKEHGLNEDQAKDLDKITDSAYKNGFALQSLKEDQKVLSNFTQKLNQNFEQLVEKNTTVADSVVALSGSLISLGSLINSIQNLGSIWKNEDLSFGQKLIRSISSLGMAIGLVTRTINANTLAHLANIGKKIINIGITKVETAAEEEHIAVTTSETAAKAGETVAEVANTEAKTGSTVATKALTVATGQYIAVALGAITALALLGAAIYFIVKAHQAEVHEIENAEQATATLKENYDNLKTSAQEFKDAISDYSEGVKALEDLTEGTKEYNEALEKSNEKARALIEKYKLFNDYEYDGNRIVISQEAIDSVQRRLNEEAAQTRVAVLQSQLYTNELKQKNNIENLIRLSGGRNNFENWNKQYQEGKYSIGEEFLVRSTDKALNGKIANAIADYNKNLEALNDEQQYLLKELAIAHFSTDKFSASLDEVAKENDKLRAAMINAQASLVNFNIDEEQLKEVTGITGKSTLESYIRENYAGNEDIIESILGGDLSKVKLNNENIAKILASQLSGLGTSDLDYSKANGKITVKDLNGNTILNELNPEFIAQNLAKLIAQGIASNLPDTLNEALLTATKNVKDLPFGEELAIAFNESVSNGELNFNSLFSQITQQQHDSLTADELSQILFKGMTIDEINQLIEQLGYENVDEYNKALAQKWAEYTPGSYDNNADERGNQKAKDFGLDEDAFKIYREHLREQYDELKNNAEAANAVAIANMRLEKGVNSIASKWEDYNEILSDSNAQFEDVAKVEGEMKEALIDILDIDATSFELLPPDFAQKNWKLITDTVNGVEGAIDELRNKAGEEILFKTKAYIEGDEETKAKIDYLNKYIEEQDFNTEIKVGVVIDDGDFFDACQNIVNEANMTAQEAQAYFASMGYDVELEEITNESPVTSSYQYRPLDLKATAQAGGVPQFGPVEDFDITNITRSKGIALKTITPNGSYGGGTGVKRKSSGGGGKKSGGGGGKTNPAENQKITSKSDAGIKRYKEIDDAISDLTKDQERLNKVTDAYYGANKLGYMKQQLGLLQKEVDLHKERFKWAQNYYNQDKAELDKYAASLGVQVDYDEDGSIKNYTAIMENLYAQLNEKETYWANAANFSSKEAQEDYKKQYVTPIADAMKEFQRLVDQFDDSNEERKKMMDDVIAQQIELKNATYEYWMFAWDIQEDILEDQLKFLDHAKKLLGDSAVEMGEILALTYGNDENYIQNTTAQLSLYRQEEEKLNELLANNEITQDKYIEGITEIRDQYLSLTENLKELDDFMMEYYAKVLDKVISETKEYTDAMKQLNDQLASYQKIMKLTGRELDYGGIGQLLEAQQQIYKDQYSVDTQLYESLQRQKVEITKMYNDAVAREDEAAIELYKTQLDELQKRILDAQDNILNDLENMAQKAQEILENARAEAMYQYEMMMSEGMGFDYIDNLLSRQSTLQDEYLTKTNQIFETTKMLRKIQSDMDSTSNRAAKERLSNFAKEIENLKNREKMTKADLELAQKKYDLLLAQIALEEAQKAKTTVRLQRDNEGNYGYVYTADEGDIAAAEDDYFNAENDLYNTRLRITNEYGEKLIQLEQEQADALAELWDEYYNKHSITEEEYEQKREEIIKHYNDLRLTYVHNYVEAQKEDVRVVADAWINHDREMIQSTEEWQTITDDLIAQTELALQRYESTSDWLRQQQEYHFGNIERMTDDVTEASDELAEEIKTKLKTEYEDLFDKVDAVYRKYGEERNAVLNNIKAYSNLAKELQNTINKYRELRDAQDALTYNSNGNTTGAGTPTVSPGTAPTSGSGGGGSGTPSGSSPKTALDMSTVGRLITEYAKNYPDSQYDKTNVKRDLIGGTYYSASEVATAVANWMQKHKKTPSSTAPTSGGGRPKTMMTAASGGYTGEWSDGSGKLAVLHSNEIVLNSHDTDNMFGIIDMVRDITNKIDLNATSLAGGYGAISSSNVSSNSSILEQNVQITASFPNATNHSEIEEAFNNLINKASQYASRR